MEEMVLSRQNTELQTLYYRDTSQPHSYLHGSVMNTDHAGDTITALHSFCFLNLCVCGGRGGSGEDDPTRSTVTWVSFLRCNKQHQPAFTACT